MKALHVSSPAEKDLSDAAAYYDQQVAGLGADFLDAVDAVLAEIEAFPERWPFRAFPVRRRLLHRFPYAVLYRSDEKEVLVLAVAHLRRRSWYWMKRL
jgi:plasmid stabilization system protein ParE